MTVELKASAGKDEPKASVKDAAADNGGLNLLSAHEGTTASGLQSSVRLALAGSSNHAGDGALTITPIPEFKTPPSPRAAGFEKAEQQVAQVQPSPDRPASASVLAPGALDAWKKTGDGLPRDAEPAEYWGRVVDYVNSNARNPLDVTTKAIHDSRVVGFGETHDVKDNGFLKFATHNMAAFKAAGMTHLALEVPSNLQPVLDNFQRTGVLKIPDHLMKDGKEDKSDAAIGALKVFQSRIKGEPGFADLLKAAQANGVKLVAADKPDIFVGFAHPEKMTALQKYQERLKLVDPALTAERNKYMADRIEGVLDGQVSPLPKGTAPAKVGFWAGFGHIGDGIEIGAPTAGKLLRDDLSARGEHYSALYGQANTQGGIPSTMFALTPYVQKPAAIATHDAGGQPNVLGRIKEGVVPGPGRDFNLSDFDQVMLFPKSR